MRSDAQNLVRDILKRFVKQGFPLINMMFAGYQAAIIPPDASPVQVLEYKRAFYAGCRMMLDLLMEASDPGEDVTVDDEALMKAVDKELREWMSKGQMAEHTMSVPPEGNA